MLGEQRLKRCLASIGCHEAMSSSLSSVAEQSPFLEEPDEIVEIGNPISSSLGALRAHLTPGLLTAVAHNVNHGQLDLRLFEVGDRMAQESVGGPKIMPPFRDAVGLVDGEQRERIPHFAKSRHEA